MQGERADAEKEDSFTPPSPHALGDVEGCQVNVLDPMKAQSRAYENPLPGRPGAGLIYGLFAGWSSVLGPRQRHRQQQL